MTMDDLNRPFGRPDALPGPFAAALVEASGELSDVTRSKKADMGTYGYKFAPLEDFLAMARPVLHAHGLAHLQLVTTEPFEKGMYVTVRTLIVHTSGATFTSPELRLLANSTDPQKVGTAITYARRYSLTATLGITGDDDDDAQALVQTAPKREPASFRSTDEADTRRLLNAAAPEVRTEIQRQFREHFGVSLSNLPKDRHPEALAFVTERLAAPLEASE